MAMAAGTFMGTIRGIPDEELNPEADAEYLYQQMRGLGTNDTNLLTFLTDRTNAQRQIIAAAYEAERGQSLMDRVKAETSGKYEKALVGLLTPPAHYDALYLRKAMDGIGTTESLLNEIICTRTGPELAEIREAFQAQTSISLVSRVAGETSGDYEKYLVMCLERGRPDDEEVDEEAATADVEVLYRAGEARWGTDEDSFIEIFATRSFAQLAEICRVYERTHGKTLSRVCEKELSGNFEDAIVLTLDHAFNRTQTWGKLIYKTMKGLGTDDDGLIRLLVTRSERDLASIRDRFGEESGEDTSLEGWITGDTSGHYRQTLLAIVLADQREPIRP